MSTNLTYAVGLSQAHSILCNEDTPLISLSTDDLWRSYSLEDSALTEVKQHLTQTRWLSKQGSWDSIGGEYVNRQHFVALSEDGGGANSFVFFSRLFNAMLEYFQRRGRGSSVKAMVHVSSVEPESTSCRPGAFLHMATETTPIPGGFNWRDLTCPFEYKLGDGEALDNDTTALWSLHQILSGDPRRTFSFGVTIHGTKLRIWLLSRTAPLTFTPFDWFEEPDSLLKFFILLATSSETDLGFDTNVKRIGDGDFQLRYDIQGTKYHTQNVLYDVSVSAATGQGAWVFEATDQEAKKERVIKDCWVEGCPGRQMEDEIVVGIKNDMGNENFHKCLIDVYGHRKTDMSGGFEGVCNILKNSIFMPAPIKSLLLIPAPRNSKPTYPGPARDSPAGQDYLQPAPLQWCQKDPPRPQFHYQVVYSEKGIPLFEVTSFSEAFTHIVQAADALHCLHEAGWVHCDLTPGSVIVVGAAAKISDVQFAKHRPAGQLEELTRPKNVSSPVARNSHTVFTPLEVQIMHYLFLPVIERTRVSGTGTESPGSGDDTVGQAVDRIKRIFLHNPLHDFESVWWIAVWFVFCCRPSGLPDDVMHAAYDAVYKDRFGTLCGGGIRVACGLLPNILQPLGDVLVEMRHVLIYAYRTFEQSFDGSSILPVFQRLRTCLERLVGLTFGLDVKPPALNQKLNVEMVKYFDAVALEEEQEGAGGEPMDIDCAQGGVVLGKETRGDSLSRADRMLTMTNQR